MIFFKVRSVQYIIFIIIFVVGLPLQAQEKRVINAIIIERGNIYEKNDDSNKVNQFTSNLINRLHIITQEEVIRRELLFKEGDFLNEKIIRESERNLRNYGFLGEVNITVQEIDVNKVNIIVKTVDQWTTTVGTSFSSVGNEYRYSLDLTEKNLLGRAYDISYRNKHETKGVIQEIKLINPRVAGSRINLQFNTSIEPDQNITGLKINSPFYSLATQWSYGAFTEIRHFDSAGVKEDDNNLYFFVSRSFGDIHKLRISPAYNLGNSTYTNATVNDKKNKNKLELSLEIIFNSDNFATTRYLDKFNRTEDVFLGNTLNLSYGKESPIFGSSGIEDTFALNETKFFRLGGENSFLKLNFNLNSRRGFIKGNYELISQEFDLRYYYKEFSYQTVVFHSQIAHTEKEFSIGGGNGLRGYDPDEFSGNKKILFNLEDRLFIYKKFLFSLIEPGATLFFDSGNVWKKNEKINFFGLNSSVGVGLRFYLVKSANYNVINLNTAYPLNARRGIVLTLGTSGSF